MLRSCFEEQSTHDLVKDDGEYKLESTKGVMLEAYDASDKTKKNFNSYGCCHGMWRVTLKQARGTAIAFSAVF